jgi:hypothetical protein
MHPLKGLPLKAPFRRLGMGTVGFGCNIGLFGTINIKIKNIKLHLVSRQKVPGLLKHYLPWSMRPTKMPVFTAYPANDPYSYP